MCGVATIPFVIWYSKPRREWARRSSSGCQSSSCNIAVTLGILSCWLVTHLAARRCTFSIACLCLVTYEGPTLRLRTLDGGVPVCCRVFLSSS